MEDATVEAGSLAGSTPCLAKVSQKAPVAIEYVGGTAHGHPVLNQRTKFATKSHDPWALVLAVLSAESNQTGIKGSHPEEGQAWAASIQHTL
jgi:hypothetical protein